MLMNERMDEGDLLRQREVRIEEAEHAPALADRLAELGAGLLVETLAGLQSGRLERRPQDHARATYAPKLTRADGAGDPALTAREIANRVRAFDPWPGVWLRRAGKRLRFLETRVAEGRGSGDPAGTLVELTPHGPVMACGGDSRLVLIRIQPEGGRPIHGRDAINGRQLRLGDRLERAPDEA
jgi:methionyl-tRNA formyltransferase